MTKSDHNFILFLFAAFPPPVGVLLHGPAGTGKSLIGKLLKANYSERFVSIRGPEIFTKFLGETESALKAKFDEAKAK